MASFTNISAYRFVPLEDIKRLKDRLIKKCRNGGIKGTVLLSPEGINLFLAGESLAIEKLVQFLETIPGLENLNPKVSPSTHQPFSRMLVRVKKEIIAFGVPGIDPANRTSPKLAAATLKQWLDEGKDLVLLDTRNDYEVKFGTFQKALPIGIKHFRDFPRAVGELPPELKNKTVVMFCTGGIRCEKAGPYMETQGFKNVFQLDGGILKYFEDVGGSHYDGDCFVFDKRVGVDPALEETPHKQCYACATPLTPEEQADSRYVEGKSCPYCYRSTEEKMHAAIAKRHAILAGLKNNLPGSQPYDHQRPLKVAEVFDGKPLLECLNGTAKHVGLAYWEEAFEQKRILGPDLKLADPKQTVRAGERYYYLTPGLSEPDVNADIRILYEDEAIILIDKPAPLPIHPCGRFNRNTLRYLLQAAYTPQIPRPAHRLDANTTGLLLSARTKHFAANLQAQFREGQVEKKYLARVHGIPDQEHFVCDLSLSEETSQVGSRFADEDGRSARTEFTLLKTFADGTSLLEVQPITGRTNQIRIHLWELGWPICGDQTYLPGKALGTVQTGTVEDAPLCLHAFSLTFTHPLSKERVRFASDAPEWASDGGCLERGAVVVFESPAPVLNTSR